MRLDMMVVAAALISVTWIGCDKPSTPDEPQPVEAPPASEKPAAVAPARPVIDDATFRLALSRAAGGPVRLVLEGKGGYHVNQEFPLHVDLGGSSAGVKLEKSSLGKADAKELSEARAAFEVPVEVASGAQEVRAKVRFAVCTEETCVPDTRTVALALTP